MSTPANNTDTNINQSTAPPSTVPTGSSSTAAPSNNAAINNNNNDNNSNSSSTTNTGGKTTAGTSASGNSVPPITGPLFHVEKHHTDDEIKERLFTIPDADKLKEEVSSVWGWFASTTTQTASKIVEDTKKNVATTSSMFSTIDLSSIASTITSIAKDVPTTLNGKENASSTASQSQQQQKKQYMLPWEPVDNPNSSAIREKILALSKDENTFLVPPPASELMANAVPQYSFQSDPEPATKMLEADPVLGAKRFMLVPRKIDENTFWSNYFYRVHLIKNSFGNINVTIPSKAALSATNRPATPTVASPPNNAAAAVTAMATAAVATTANEPKSEIPSTGDQKKWEESIRTELAMENSSNALNGGDSDNFEMLDDDELLAGVDVDDE